MDKERKECIFLWFIENYSYCWHKNGGRLISPEFTDDDLEGTVWCLRLYPRGRTDKQPDSINLFLGRSLEDDGPEDFPLKFELALLAADGSPLISKEMEFTFKKRIGHGMSNLIRMDDVLLRRKAEFLPQDTLSVRCKIWRGEGEIKQVKQIAARTRIGIEEISFLHTVECFSTLESNQVKTIHITSPLQRGFDLSSSLYFSDGSCCKDKIVMEIAPTDENQILSKCTVSSVDKSGKLIKCGGTGSRLNTTKNGAQKLPLCLTKQDLLDKKSEYLPGDKLSLLCECYFSTGVEFEKIERIWFEMPSVVLNQLHDECHNKDGYNTSEKLSACASVSDDLKTIYNNQVYTDMKLKTKMKTFPAHKLVLCARSVVFKAMLSNDMKEHNTNCIEVDDLDDDTVHQLLLFLYSDVLRCR
ncbi:Speckle-type POZ protein-like like protein [Argiope bruennichi]|uniref:Speckle-type POZ protein-like like protein n=1 Tax=Argiope bruennichi TaxID=94029 RepID=A0A8T0ETJ2_ARGBR|nr:Speckle-type POZ protein-like like protein [Argiope bruennichi]